jgi:DNA repair protein RadC
MQEPVRRANGPAEGVAEVVAHNDVADGAADAEKVREVALRVPGASPVLDGWAASAGEGTEDVPLAEELRPRVRLRTVGAEALSAAELLAVLFSAFPGTSEARALELAGRAISERGGLHGLLRSSVHEIMGTVGLGEAKASALLVAAELGKRMVLEPAHKRPVISSPGDVDRLLRSRMAHLDRERFVVVLLNTKNAVLGTHTVSIGTLSSSLVHPREVFKPAIQEGAAA